MYKTKYEAIDAMYRGLELKDESFSPYWGDKHFVLSAFQKYSLIYTFNKKGSKQVMTDYVEKLMQEFRVFYFTMPVSDEIKQLCEGKDPVDALSKAIWTEKLSDKEFVLSAFQKFQVYTLTEALKRGESGQVMTDYVEKLMQEFRVFYFTMPVSDEIRQICEEQNPIEALTKAINYEKLTKKLAPGVEVGQPKRKLKI